MPILVGLGSWDFFLPIQIEFPIRPNGSNTKGKMTGDPRLITRIPERPGPAPTTLPPDYLTVVFNSTNTASKVH